MNAPAAPKLAVFIRYGKLLLKSLFSLKEGRADRDVIDATLRAGVNMSGHNLWVLILAILIASIGLNVNSTAIIIGAMLISPLMGPIMGIGYGISLYDFSLLKKAGQQLLVASLIGLLASALYFLISPLGTVQSELLSRTRPTFWDVAIALFGGLAGIISATRKEKTNVIPGVAIATALMPPLCTAGFGLAKGEWEYFFGAAYLFIINCVFIAFSTVIIIRAFRFPSATYVDFKTSRRIRFWLTTSVLITMIPSMYLAYRLVSEEIYKSRASQFVVREFTMDGTHVVETEIDPVRKTIEVTLLGEPVSKARLEEIRYRMPLEGIANSALVVNQSETRTVDILSLKASVISELYRDTSEQLQHKESAIQQLKDELQPIKERKREFSDIAMELNTLFPEIKNVYLSDTYGWQEGKKADDMRKVVMLYATAVPVPSRSEQARLKKWLKVRSNADDVIVVITGV